MPCVHSEDNNRRNLTHDRKLVATVGIGDGRWCARRRRSLFARWLADASRRFCVAMGNTGRQPAWRTARRISGGMAGSPWPQRPVLARVVDRRFARRRSEEHTSELQSLMRISYAVFCLKKKKNTQ